jgi:tryptophan halogenase
VGLIETAAYLLSYLFPHDGQIEPAARHFNTLMAQRFERIVDFVKLHYALTQRTDTEFWIDNTRSASIPESLQARLAAWRGRPPHRLDFVTDLEMYPPSSWQYVLYGMEYPTDLQAGRAAYPRLEEARMEFATIREVAARALRDLPSHRALVQHMGRRPEATAP